MLNSLKTLDYVTFLRYDVGVILLAMSRSFLSGRRVFIFTEGHKMIGFTITFYLVGILLLICGIAVWNGKTELIHDYHQKNVTDHKGYGKAMGKAISGSGFSMCFSATVSLLGADWLWLSLGVFAVGFTAMLILMFIIQKKYNGSLFS